ncbi:glutaredoxin family protein [Candidatus Parcubacteria bacterium]|nr:glutaredoxin family protein [Candidatus Parcubacteria bacterium]
MPKIKIYTTPTCPFCQMAKEYLKEKGFEFEEIDVSIDERAAQEMIEKSGQMGVPVIEIDDQIVIGFDKEKIDKILNIRE